MADSSGEGFPLVLMESRYCVIKPKMHSCGNVINSIVKLMWTHTDVLSGSSVHTKAENYVSLHVTASISLARHVLDVAIIPSC